VNLLSRVGNFSLGQKRLQVAGYKKWKCTLPTQKGDISTVSATSWQKPCLCNFLTLVTLYNRLRVGIGVYGLKCDLDSMADGLNEPIHRTIRNPW
jgi:hypothetical protein